MIGIRISVEAGNFSLHYRFQTVFGAHPDSYPIGTRALSPEVKRPVREADYSPPSTAEVKEFMAPYLHFSNTPYGVVRTGFE
jgi:hypothetical protein